MLLTFPELSLVLLVGPSGCGKSTFARQHFRPTEIVSSDHYRGVVCDDESNQEASKDAFELLHQVVARRLEWMRFTVVDATNLLPESRRPLLELAKRYHYLTGAILFDLHEEVCQQQNLLRQGRTVPPRVISSHARLLQSALPALEREVHRYYVLHSLEQIANVQLRRVPLWVDRREETGPFDIIGDVHGCLDELLSLLAALDYHIGYQTNAAGVPEPVIVPPPGRKLIFVGDLGDRGPDTPGVYRLVMRLVASNQALCVLGNHDSKLLRRLRGNLIRPTHGLQLTLEQLEREPPALTSQIRDFLDHRPNHYVLDGGRLVVAHAGLREDLQGRSSGKVHSFALFGDTTGKLDEAGLPIRLNWAADYKGRALVVYGHTPQAEPQWLNNTINIDTGCVFGHRLTALRYPERELVSVPALRAYAKPARDFLQPSSREAVVEEE